jgi:hypothetical protein
MCRSPNRPLILLYSESVRLFGPLHLILFVSLAAMSNGDDVNKTFWIVNSVDHPIVANPNPPEVFLAAQLPTARSARLFGQGLYLREDSINECCLERLKLSAR